MFKFAGLFLFLISTVAIAQEQPQQAAAQTTPAVSPVPVPQVVPATPEPQGGAAVPSPVPTPTATPVPPVRAINFEDIEADPTLRNKSPFMIPTSLWVKIKRKQKEGEKFAAPSIDDAISPRIRWPAREYTLIAILSGSRNPKVFIMDKEGRTHTFRNREYIGNGNGYIAEINKDEVIVVERGSEVKLKLKSK